MPMSGRSFEEFVLADPEGRNWELHDGQLLEKPSLSAEHNHAMTYVGIQVMNQLDPHEYRARVNAGFLTWFDATYLIPDSAILPAALVRAQRRGPEWLERYADPLPHVIEVWSPFDLGLAFDQKLSVYRCRGDREIVCLDPFERVLSAWRRHPDGTYDVTTTRGGTVQPIALPNVTIDLDALFD